LALSEIALVTARKQLLQSTAQKGDRGAKRALSLIETPNRFLSSIQVGITTVGIFMGAYSGVTLSAFLNSWFIHVPYLQKYSEQFSLSLIVVIVSYFSLVLGELVPKRIGLAYAETLSAAVAHPMYIISVIASPVVKLLSKSTDFVLHLLNLSRTIPVTTTITEEEIVQTIEMGKKAGLVEPDEQKMITRIFEFGDRQALSIMTPRTDVIWLDLDDPVQKNYTIIGKYQFSRFPLVRGDPDRVIGVINTRDLIGTEPVIRFGKYIQTPLFIPEHMPVLHVLELFRHQPLHFAVVIDEYGGFSGIITPYDVLQAIVGELPAPHETVIPTIKKEGSGYYLIDGALPVQEFKVFFDISKLPEEDTFGTVAGFAIRSFGHIPSAGEKFTWNKFEFSVIQMEDNRIVKLRVHQLPINDSFDAISN
jgi:putative hemolysin